MPPVGDNTALFLDIDGTLLDLAQTPDRVKVPRELLIALERLSQQLSGALAFVSGRSMDGIDRLFAPFKPAAIGAHGGEIRGANGEVTRCQALPETVVEVFRGLADNIPGLLLEDKRSTLALHYRGAPALASLVHRTLRAHMTAALAFESGWRLQPGKSILEIKPDGRDKGTAILEYMSEPPFAHRRPVFVGDGRRRRYGDRCSPSWPSWALRRPGTSMGSLRCRNGR